MTLEQLLAEKKRLKADILNLELVKPYCHDEDFRKLTFIATRSSVIQTCLDVLNDQDLDIADLPENIPLLTGGYTKK